MTNDEAKKIIQNAILSNDDNDNSNHTKEISIEQVFGRLNEIKTLTQQVNQIMTKIDEAYSDIYLFLEKTQNSIPKKPKEKLKSAAFWKEKQAKKNTSSVDDFLLKMILTSDMLNPKMWENLEI